MHCQKLIRKVLYTALLLAATIIADAQVKPDTLEEVTVIAFVQNKPAARSTAVVNTIRYSDNIPGNKTSLLNNFNNISGVRMEERSPGSYRLNIRGSSLRSPFGVRNIKAYWNDLSLTDAGGNTYFNQLAVNSFTELQIFKGPPSSFYGAGTGGLLVMHTDNNHLKQTAAVEINAGSFGTTNLLFDIGGSINNISSRISYAGNHTDGYRVHSSLTRHNITWQSTINTGSKMSLKLSAMYTRLRYKTPGALTQSEFNSTPANARPATGNFPSAVDANAGIAQHNFLGGISNTISFGNNFSNTTAIYFSYAGVNNPAIRNFEIRTEPTVGGRTHFKINKTWNQNKLLVVWGAEWQRGNFSNKVYRNINGKPDTLQTDDKIINRTGTYFLQTDIELAGNWIISLGSSFNKYKVSITRNNIVPIVSKERTYQNEIAPRFAIRKNILRHLSLLLSAGKGYSPPTIAEVLPSSGVINTSLEAEYGWNYESTLQYVIRKRNHRFQPTITCFIFNLRNALVQKRDAAGADFFENAGRVNQQGLEFQTEYQYVHKGNKKIAVSHIKVSAAYTVNYFKYGNYIKAGFDYTGNKVPSVPSKTLAILYEMQLNNLLYTQVNYYHAGNIYLNDANDALAPSYNVVDCRVGVTEKKSGNFVFKIYIGAGNLLNEKYSAGHDINAAGGRYYNTATAQNFYTGVIIRLAKKNKIDSSGK